MSDERALDLRHWPLFAVLVQVELELGVGRSLKRRLAIDPVLDLKTSNGVYGETAIQTAAYAKFEFYLDENGEERPMPKIERTFVAHITPFGTDLHPLCTCPAEIDEAYRQFLCASYITKTAKRRKDFLRDPLPTPVQVVPLAS